ncbi:MAG: C40 family peptidase [Pseudoflavonifractor capillosus]|nr:C40 family peptidase [Pseudoflavonifractor capillosus]
MGIDCSGLCSMAYLLCGVIIWRDAAIREGYPIRPIPRENMRPGDLLFFPGHVAMYLGDGRYIHATARAGDDGVVINSLRPGHADYRVDLAGSLTAVGSIF